jgi:hypothetical protein
MLICTSDAVRAILRMDPTLDIQIRTRIINAMLKAAKEPSKTPEPPQPVPCLIRKEEVARRLSVSMRTVDHLVTDGALTKVYLPGRGRGLGFRESDVNELINSLTGPKTPKTARILSEREKQRALRKSCVEVIEQYRGITGVEIKGPVYDAMSKMAELIGEPMC